jgi:hypothetical protein
MLFWLLAAKKEEAAEVAMLRRADKAPRGRHIAGR